MKLKLALGIVSAVCLLQGAQSTFANATSEAVDPTEPVLSTVSAGSEGNASSEAPATADKAHPYSIITDRNVFQLTEPPPPDMGQVEAALPTIKMTGIFKMTGQPTRALFVSVPKDAKETPTYFNLAEGERQDNLEVVKILEKDESAEVINAGTKATIAMKDTKSTVAATGAVPPAEFAARVASGRQFTPQPPMPQPQIPQQPQDQPQQPNGGGSVLIVGGSSPAPANPAATPGAAPAGIVPAPGMPPTPPTPPQGARSIPRPIRPIPSSTR